MHNLSLKILMKITSYSNQLSSSNASDEAAQQDLILANRLGSFWKTCLPKAGFQKLKRIDSPNNTTTQLTQSTRLGFIKDFLNEKFVASIALHQWAETSAGHKSDLEEATARIRFIAGIREDELILANLGFKGLVEVRDVTITELEKNYTVTLDINPSCDDTGNAQKKITSTASSERSQSSLSWSPLADTSYFSRFEAV